MNNLFKSILKRQIPYFIGGTITGTIIAYYYGFLITIIVNSIIWFAISTLINKYYWKYTGFNGEIQLIQLISKYIKLVRKGKSKNKFIKKAYKRFEEVKANNHLSSNDKGTMETDNLGSPLKI